MTMVFLLTGTTSFPDPGNWNPVNSVEIVGAGGYATRMSYSAPPLATRDGDPQPQPLAFYAGFGGSGGGYGIGHNRTDPFPVALNIATGASTPVWSGPWYSNWGDPSGGGSSGNGNRGAVYAGNATWQVYPSPPATPVAGGPDAGYAGGPGGSSSTVSGAYYAAGGGGAAGPHGAGSMGSSTATTPTTGGAADNSTVAGGSGAGAAGNNGTQWDPSHGCGSGGAGNNNALAGGAGGRYGGGAGGAGGTYTGGYINGGDALIVVTYTPIAPAAQTNVAIMA